jgi:hypothetical protein
MIYLSVLLSLLAGAVFFALFCVTSKTAEKFLWGSALCSLFLGASMQLSGGKYWGFIALGSFLITDLIVYLALRSLGFGTKGEAKHPRFDKILRIFFLWVAGSIVSLFLGSLFLGDQQLMVFSPQLSAPPNLEEKIWDQNWILILVPMGALVAHVVGGFFLVRKEKKE